MADYWVCSECGAECEVADVGTELVPDYRSECCGALPEYRSDTLDRDWDPRQDWDETRDIDY